MSETAREDGTLVHARVGEREFSVVQPFRLEQGARADAG
jgi:hypothetical protein